MCDSHIEPDVIRKTLESLDEKDRPLYLSHNFGEVWRADFIKKNGWTDQEALDIWEWHHKINTRIKKSSIHG
jgi:hypothetical protein